MFAILIILGKHQNGGNVDEDNLDDTTPYADFSVPDLFNHVSNNNGYPRQYHQSKLGKNNFINTINFIYMTTNSSFFGMPLYKIMDNFVGNFRYNVRDKFWGNFWDNFLDYFGDNFWDHL